MLEVVMVTHGEDGIRVRRWRREAEGLEVESKGRNGLDIT